MIYYGAQSVNRDDIDAVSGVLECGNLTQGEQVPLFEKTLCEYTGAKHAVAVNSGTSGLHIACLALSLQKGDIVYTTPNTFVASANCALYCGSKIDFVDIDPVTRQMSVSLLKEKLSESQKNNCLPKAIVLVHFAGHGCDLEAFYQLSLDYGFSIIEDNAHGLGGKYKKQYALGKPFHSIMTVCSFHPVKSITTCEGGAVLTNDDKLARKLRQYASHGITKNANEFESDSFGPAHFEQQLLGYNYRLSDVHAVLGVSQMQRIDSLIQARRERAKRYIDELSILPLKLPIWDESSAWHLFVVELLEHDKQFVYDKLKSKGIVANSHYIPVHWHPYFQSLGFFQGQFPQSENYFERAVTLPLFPDLSADNQTYIIQSLKEMLS
ncbi:UDP-4-amino-4,6-dideoxy-N-acetyl-beta-L-altrosamine transaminase [Alteromonas sp. 5E99-2]|uniref:UDP-4-amino-4, 6-dideoxy-N-acetyl-beta-L-altrosamine transaminase n=1 Tax=Alteromonas sp. 5E99-2 TaxID=2817683 RepID=UPI001A98D40D|nr:UDP-4-amino-4,6-dideoxy-N-acetyl-beta-L-altrosamine transaminase [Alteromonas sp. 5E99-2]MBO1255245.1 UDP-4-amino-4,6-dideoxy-N-acetyl-beta-L-altrosamine transaminase [Alteromonas sp. 5E99-2]